MKDCRFCSNIGGGNLCSNPAHLEDFCEFEDADKRFKCVDYQGKNAPCRM